MFARKEEIVLLVEYNYFISVGAVPNHKGNFFFGTQNE